MAGRTCLGMRDTSVRSTCLGGREGRQVLPAGFSGVTGSMCMDGNNTCLGAGITCARSTCLGGRTTCVTNMYLGCWDKCCRNMYTSGRSGGAVASTWMAGTAVSTCGSTRTCRLCLRSPGCTSCITPRILYGTDRGGPPLGTDEYGTPPWRLHRGLSPGPHS